MKADTIAAIATASGRGGIGIVRISGPEAERILKAVFEPAGGKDERIESHRFRYGWIHDGGERLDEGMAVLMRGPGSYTREDVAEIQAHGGTQGLQRVLEACIRQGARLAEAGEFTRRAFVNGRIDLSRAEAVMRLVAARGEQERQAAVRQMSGGTAAFVRKASDALYRLQAGVSACIDYPEEISEEEGAAGLREGIESLIRELREAIDERSSRLIRDGMRVTLFGVPNAGKSSILNALLGEERAIVTAVPGTTRDTVEGEIQIGGIRVFLTDTAGMRETEDPVEKLGVDRSRKAREWADAALLILDGSREITGEERRMILSLRGEDAAVINKTDLERVTTAEDVRKIRPETRCMEVSAMRPETLGSIRDFFRESAEVRDDLAITQPRHLEAVRRAVGHLEDALETLEHSTADMAGVDLMAAQDALSEITGDRADEKLLDAVFSEFCVGK